jgi:hypothetical protein
LATSPTTSTNNGSPTGKIATRETSANITAREQLITIPAKTIIDLEFMDTFPNYVYINNYSGGTLYFGRSVLPTSTVYDMIIDGHGDNLYSSPNSFRTASLYNDGADVVNAKITSFVAPFNPAALKGGGGMAAATSSGPASNVTANITNFDVPLPSGNNHIGVVTVDTMPTQTITMGELAAGTNHIGSVSVDSLAPLSSGTSHIGSVGIDGGVTITSMPPVQVADSPVATAHQMWDGVVDSATVGMTSFVFANQGTINMINYVKNDGDTDLYFAFDTIDPTVPANRTNGVNGAIRLRAGESISDFGRKCSQINFFRITGNGNVRFLGA